MDKKKGLKLGACSLLVGLLALTACGKKKNVTTKEITIKPSTTTKRTTTKKVTSEQKTAFKKINVYIDGKLLSDENNTIEFTYGDEYDLKSKLVVKGIREGKTDEEIITNYIVSTNLDDNSDAGNYRASVKVGNITSSIINVVVKKKTIDASKLTWDYTEEFTYDGNAHSVSIKNLPEEVLEKYETNLEDGNSKVDAGTYYTKAYLKEETTNYIVTNSENGVTLSWKINKKKLDFSNVKWDYTTPFVYDGSTKKVQLINVPSEITPGYLDAEGTNAGNYTTYVSFSGVSSNYEIINNENLNTTLNWEIKKASFDLTGVTWKKTPEFVYDGEEKEVTLTELPAGLVPTYENNKKTDAGDYTATVSFATSDNYEVINNNIEPLAWSIARAEFDLENVIWQETKEYDYDGEEKEVVLLNLPNGLVYEYHNNKATNAGEYTASVTFAVGENYTLKNADHIGDCDWKINKIDAVVEDFSIYNKIYDGTAIEYTLTGVTDGAVKVLYAVKGEDTFSEEAPVNAGDYVAKLVLTDTDNYNGLDKDYIVNFTIFKALVKAIKDQTYYGFISEHTGSELTLGIPGFDSNLMELKENDEVVNSISHTDAGVYYFDICLKDSTNYFWEGHLLDNSVLSYRWIIQKNYFNSITINGDSKSYEDFLKYDFKVGDSLYLPANSAYEVEIDHFENSYEIEDDVETLIIKVLDSNTYDILAYYSFDVDKIVKAIKINGHTFDSNTEDLIYELQPDEKTLNIILYDANTSYYYGISNNYSFEYEDDYTMQINYLQITLNVEDLKNENYYIRAFENKFDDEGRKIFEFTVTCFNPVESILVNSYNLIGDEYSMYYENKTNYYGNYELYSELNEYGKLTGSSIITGLDIKFKDGYEDCTYKIIDLETNSDYDFTKVKREAVCEFVIYKDGKEIYTTNMEFYNCMIGVENSSYCQMNGKDEQCVVVDKGEITFTPIIDGYDLIGSLVFDEKDDAVKEYSDYGVYVEKLNYSVELYGITYTYEFYLDVICSLNSEDYGTFEFNLDSYYGGSYCNLFSDTMGVSDYLDITGDWLDYSLNDDYEVTSYSYYLINEYDSATRRLVVKASLTDGLNDVDLYFLVATDSNFIGSLAVMEEKIDRTNLFSDETSIDIENDVINLTDISKADSFSIFFEQEVFAAILKGDEVIAGDLEELDDEMYFSFTEEGKYCLLINNYLGESRAITINVSGNFDHILTLSIKDEEGYVLHFDDSSDDDYEYTTYDHHIDYYLAFFDEGAVDYVDIINCKIEVNLSGVALGKVYEDYNLKHLIENEKMAFTVYNDRYNNPYIEFYFQDGEWTRCYRAYLNGKPKAKITFDFGDGQEFGVVNTQYGVLGDFDNYDGKYAFILDSAATDSFTIRTDKTYGDRNYAIIMGDSGFMNVGLFETSHSIEELKTYGCYYTVDSNTLTRTIPLTCQFIAMVLDDTDDVITSEDVVIFYINKISLFDISIDDENYYTNATFEYEDEDYGIRVDVDTNTDDLTDSVSYYDYDSIPQTYVYYIGEDELEKVITKDGKEKYKVKLNSAFGFNVFATEDSYEILQKDKDGYYTVDMQKTDFNESYCSLFLDSYEFNGRIEVRLMFLDERPTGSYEVIGNKAYVSNLIDGVNEFDIVDGVASLSNINTYDTITLNFKEYVNVTVEYDLDEEPIFEKIAKSVTIPAGYSKYLIFVNNPYGIDERVITLNVSYEYDSHLLGIEAENGYIYYDNDLITSDFQKNSKGLLCFIGDEMQGYISDDKVYLTLVGGSINNLYTDSTLETLIDYNLEQSSTTLDVLYDTNNNPYAMLYLKTSDGSALPITIYITDELGEYVNIIINDKSYEIGTTEDLLGEIEYFDNIGAYMLIADELSPTITLKLNRYYDDYSYSFVRSSSSLDENMTLEELEEAGYLFRPVGENLSVDIISKTYGDPVEYYIIPKGATGDMAFKDLEPQSFDFYIQKNNYIFNIEVNGEEYYATNYMDFTQQTISSDQDTNASYYEIDGEKDAFTKLCFFLGDSEKQKISGNKYALKFDTDYVISRFTTEYKNEGEVGLEVVDGYIYLEVKKDEALYYVSFTASVAISPYSATTIEIRFYLEDDINLPIKVNVGEKTYNVGLPDIKKTYNFFYQTYASNKINCDEPGALSFTFDEYYDDYSYAIVINAEEVLYFDYRNKTVKELEELGYVIRPKNGENLTIPVNYRNYSSAISFTALPYGTTGDHIYKGEEDGYYFLVQRPAYVMNLTLGENNYYYTVFNDYSYYGNDQLIQEEKHNAATCKKYDNGLIKELTYYIGSSELDNVVSNQYTMKINTDFSNISLYKSEEYGEDYRLNVDENNVVTLDVKEDESNNKYVEFYYGNATGETAHIILYLTDGIID